MSREDNSKPIYLQKWYIISFVILVISIGIVACPNKKSRDANLLSQNYPSLNTNQKPVSIANPPTETQNSTETKYSAAPQISTPTSTSTPTPTPTPVIGTGSSAGKSFLSVIQIESLKNDFINACREIGLETSLIKDFNKTHDWAGGERYTFMYKQTQVMVYANGNTVVRSININDEQIYSLGYESFAIDEYIPDSHTVATLQVYTEEKIRDYLQVPSSGKFSFFDWRIVRKNEIYELSSSVTAKNAFGMEKDVPFSVKYRIESGKTTLIHLWIDGKEVISIEQPQQPARKEEAIHSLPEVIRIIDGVKGEYGQTVKLDKHEYIWYKVPAGRYTVTNNGKWSIVWVDKDKTIKNSSGYTEQVTVSELQFKAANETGTLEITDDQHISLTANASITLKRID